MKTQNLSYFFVCWFLLSVVGVFGNDVRSLLGDPMRYPNISFILTGELRITGGRAARGDSIAAFVGDELRGVSSVETIESRSLFILSVSVGGAEEMVHFRFHDANVKKFYTVDLGQNQTRLFDGSISAGGKVGSLENPIQFSLTLNRRSQVFPMIGWWRFDDPGGCIARDSIRGKDGELKPNCSRSNAPVWTLTETRLDQALKFDGANDYVDLGWIEPGDPLQVANSNTTIAVWFRQEEGGNGHQRIVDKSTGGGGRSGYALSVHPGDRSVWLSVNGSSYKTMAEVYRFNRWTHVAAVVRNTRFEIYVDGRRKRGEFHRSGSASLPPEQRAKMRIGRRSTANTNRFKGSLDDLRIYHGALPPNDIMNIKNEAPPRLIAHYKFDNGGGCSTVDSVTGPRHKVGLLAPACAVDSPIHNGPTWSAAAAVGSHALQFDGDDDHVDLGRIERNHPLQLLSGGTLSAWFMQQNGDGWQRIIDKSRGGKGAGGYSLYANPKDRSVALSISGTEYKSQPNVYKFDHWTHVVGIITRNEVVIHVKNSDGHGTTERFPNHSTKLPPNVRTTMRFGTWNHSTGREFKGFLDDIRIYDGPLTEQQIEHVFNAHSTPSTPVAAARNALASTRVSSFRRPAIASYTLYEDGEDGTTDGWMIYGSGAVTNEMDESGNAIISIEGNRNETPFRLGFPDGRDWNNSKEFHAYYAVLMNDDAATYFRVETTDGERFLSYVPGDQSIDVTGNTIRIGLGFPADGKWHRVKRNLRDDLQLAHPDLRLLSVMDFFVYGSLKLDDLMLIRYESEGGK